MTPAEKKVYDAMSFSDIYQLRAKAGNNRAAQNELAPYEHQAFVRESMQDAPAYVKPFRAIGMAAAIPAYSASKALGINEARSDASIEEMARAYRGLMQGLFQ